ncbi:MAG TPA: hypothetical protein VGA73_06300, partial [Candidatus Binatia bacterium]
LATAILASGDLGRPIVAPPGVPAARVRILREAFKNVMRDPVFLDDVKKKKLEADPTFGEELETIARDAVAQPRDVIERITRVLEQ